MKRILSRLTQLSRQMGLAGTVFPFLFLGFISILQGQEEYSIRNSYSFVKLPSSPLTVNPFEESFISLFSMDSVSALRGIYPLKNENIELWTEISDDWTIITFYEATYGAFLKVPFTAPVEWYFQQQLR